MSKHGNYRVKNIAKDRSFTFFICWLTVFLVLLLAVYLALTYYIGNLKKIQNIVDRNALNSANNAEITYPSHKTSNFLEIDEGDVTNGPNGVIKSSVPSDGEEFLDEKYSRNSSSGTTVSKDFTEDIKSNQSQDRTEVKSTISFKTDNATVKYTTVTDSTIVTKLMKLNQPLKHVPSIYFTPTTIPYQDISTEKQTFLDERYFKEPTPTVTQSTLVKDVTEWNQIPKNATNEVFSPTTISDQDISTEKQKFLDETSSTEPSSAATESTLVRDITEWNQIPKNSTNEFFSSTKILYLDETYSTEPSPTVTQSILVSEEPSFLATESTSVNTFSTPTTIQYRYINKEKQHHLDETYSKAQSSTATESTESMESKKLNQRLTSISNIFSAPEITLKHQGHYTEKLNIVDEMSSTQSSFDISESHVSMQSEEPNTLQDISTTKSTRFNFLIPRNQSVQELTETSQTRGITKAKDIVTESERVHKHSSSVAATLKGAVSLMNLQNMTSSPYSETTFSSIVELLSVTGSLSPLTESLTHLDEAVTQIGTTRAAKYLLSTSIDRVSHTTVDGEHVAEADEEHVADKFDLESLNKLDGAVCDGHMCRKAAAKTLYQIDFDADVCKYPYTYFCGGGKIEKWDFLDMIMKDMIGSIKRIDEKSPKYYQVFAETFYMCNKFSSFSVLEQIHKDEAKLPKEYKDFIGELLLTQSIPIFDIDVSPIGNVFQIQISPPGLDIRKASTFRWSLLNHVRSSCIDESTKSLNATVDMRVISEDIKICCKKKLLSYIQKYAGNTSNNETLIIQPKIMERYRRWIKTYEDPEWNYVNITMKDFCDGKDYHLGVEWRDLFLTIGIPYNASSIIRIYYPERVKKVMSQAMSNEREIMDTLKAWYRIQAYSNMVQLINRNNARYCLELVSELMPDVASVMVQEAVDESMYNDSLTTVKTLNDSLRQTFIKSLPKMNKERKASEIIKDELNEVRLMPSMSLKVTNSYDVKMEDTFYGSVMALLKHRKKSVFELLKGKVKIEFLLKYFVSPFDSRLHTFDPYKTIVFQPGFLYRAFEMEFLPRQMYLSKIGFILAEVLMKFHTHLERGQSKINKMNESVSGYGYLIEGEEYSFSQWILPENQMRNDKLSLELILRHLLEDSREMEKMSWLNGTFSNSQAFIISTVQEFCDWSTAADVTKELYNNRLPAPFRIRSLMLSSKFALESFNCK